MQHKGCNGATRSFPDQFYDEHLLASDAPTSNSFSSNGTLAKCGI